MAGHRRPGKHWPEGSAHVGGLTSEVSLLDGHGHRSSRDHKVGRLWSALAMLVPVVVALGLVACAGEVPEVTLDDPGLVNGREVYARNCVACHGAAGEGGTGPKLADGALAEQAPDMTDSVTVVAEGRGRMPAFAGKLTDNEIENVVRYIREVL